MLGLSSLVPLPSWPGPSQVRRPPPALCTHPFCALVHRAACVQPRHTSLCLMAFPTSGGPPGGHHLSKDHPEGLFLSQVRFRRGQSLVFLSVASFLHRFQGLQTPFAQALHIPVFRFLCFSGFSFLSFPGSHSVCIFWGVTWLLGASCTLPCFPLYPLLLPSLLPLPPASPSTHLFLI